jgi:hypothetical protein
MHNNKYIEEVSSEKEVNMMLDWDVMRRCSRMEEMHPSFLRQKVELGSWSPGSKEKLLRHLREDWNWPYKDS